MFTFKYVNTNTPSYFTGNVGIATPTPSYTLHVNGSVAGTSAYNQISDLRLKTEIQKIPNALEKILSLQGVFYNWRIDEFPDRHFSNRKEMGVIAQNVEKVFPEAITRDNKGFRSVAYSMLIAPLIESTKELYLKITNQDHRISNLENEIEQLRKDKDLQKDQIHSLNNALCELGRKKFCH